MTYNEMIDIFERDYVLTLDNDGDLYRAVQVELKKPSFKGLLTLVESAVKRLRIGSLEPSYLYVPCRRYAVQVWEANKGSRDNSFYLQAVARIAESDEALGKGREALTKQPATQTEIPTPTVTPREVQMKITNITYINGNDITKMSENDLIQTIRGAEAQIKDLSTIETSSKKLDVKRAELQAFIVEVVKILDAR